MSYQEDRQANYPSIGDQLDMIFSDLKKYGPNLKDGDWYKSILKVKMDYPKPDVTKE